jgi:DNA repair protein RecO (recombination protein O)
MTVEQDRNPQLYSIAVDSLSLLERVSASRLELALWYFQIQAAGALGYRPHLGGCAVTGEALRGPRVWFSPSLGGTANQEAPGPGLSITLGTVRFLEWLQASDAGRLDEAAYDTAAALEVRRALKLFLIHHTGLGRPQKAGAFLDRLIAGGAPRKTWSLAADAGPGYQVREEG